MPTSERATATHSTLLVPGFPIALRLRVRAKAMLERRPMREVIAELIEKALAMDAKAETKKKESKA